MKNSVLLSMSRTERGIVLNTSESRVHVLHEQRVYATSKCGAQRKMVDSSLQVRGSGEEEEEM